MLTTGTLACSASSSSPAWAPVRTADEVDVAREHLRRVARRLAARRSASRRRAAPPGGRPARPRRPRRTPACAWRGAGRRAPRSGPSSAREARRSSFSSRGALEQGGELVLRKLLAGEEVARHRAILVAGATASRAHLEPLPRPRLPARAGAAHAAPATLAAPRARDRLRPGQRLAPRASSRPCSPPSRGTSPCSRRRRRGGSRPWAARSAPMAPSPSPRATRARRCAGGSPSGAPTSSAPGREGRTRCWCARRGGSREVDRLVLCRRPERRRLLWARVAGEGGRLGVGCLHLTVRRPEQAAAEALRAAAWTRAGFGRRPAPPGRGLQPPPRPRARALPRARGALRPGPPTSGRRDRPPPQRRAHAARDAARAAPAAPRAPRPGRRFASACPTTRPVVAAYGWPPREAAPAGSEPSSTSA